MVLAFIAKTLCHYHGVYLLLGYKTRAFHREPHAGISVTKGPKLEVRARRFLRGSYGVPKGFVVGFSIFTLSLPQLPEFGGLCPYNSLCLGEGTSIPETWGASG